MRTQCRVSHQSPIILAAIPQVAAASGLPYSDGQRLLELFLALDAEGTASVTRYELQSMISRNFPGSAIRTDAEIALLSAWLDGLLDAEADRAQPFAEPRVRFTYGHEARRGNAAEASTPLRNDVALDFGAFCRVVRAAKDRYPDLLSTWGLADVPRRRRIE